MGVKLLIALSEIQIARFLSDQTEIRLKYPIDIFNYTKDPLYFICNRESKRANLDIQVRPASPLLAYKPNESDYSEVQQTELNSQHLVPVK